MINHPHGRMYACEFKAFYTVLMQFSPFTLPLYIFFPSKYAETYQYHPSIIFLIIFFRSLLTRFSLLRARRWTAGGSSLPEFSASVSRGDSRTVGSVDRFDTGSTEELAPDNVWRIRNGQFVMSSTSNWISKNEAGLHSYENSLQCVQGSLLTYFQIFFNVST